MLPENSKKKEHIVERKHVGKTKQYDSTKVTNTIIDDIGINLDLKDYVAPYEKAYLIAMTPRSGSSMLCDMLAKTGLAGTPKEYLNQKLIMRSIEDYGPQKMIGDLLTTTIENTMDNQKMFGIKVSYYQAEPFIKYGVFDRLFPNIKIINLFRRNILKQAISLYIASETKFFHTGHGSEKKRDALLNDLKFNRHKIFSQVKAVYNGERGWMQYLDENAHSYIKLFYEDNIKEIERTLKTVLMYIGVEEEKLLNLEYPESKYKKIALSKNDEFFEICLNDDALMTKTRKMGLQDNRLFD